jgi:hypothetical protein
MKEVTLKIPENKIEFFLELVKHLGFEVSDEMETSNDYEIPEEHKSIVRERMANARPEDYIPWEVARKRLNFKSKKD